MILTGWYSSYRFSCFTGINYIWNLQESFTSAETCFVLSFSVENGREENNFHSKVTCRIQTVFIFTDKVWQNDSIGVFKHSMVKHPCMFFAKYSTLAIEKGLAVVVVLHCCLVLCACVLYLTRSFCITSAWESTLDLWDGFGNDVLFQKTLLCIPSKLFIFCLYCPS